MDRDAFLRMHETPLGAYVAMSRAVGARADYVQGGGGNTSVKLGAGLMAIKASGFRLSDLRIDAAYAVLDGAALRTFYDTHEEAEFEDVEKVGSDAAKSSIMPIEGLPALRPSVEAGFHSLLDRFVVHSHSVYANLACCSEGGHDIAAEALADALYSFGFVPYVDPGAKLTFRIRDELARVEREAGMRPAVLLLENHGLVVHHDDPEHCLSIHADVNTRLAAAFGLSSDSFPEVALAPAGDGLLASATPFVRDALRTGRYDQRFFLERPLYPDQMVFLVGTFDIDKGLPTEGHCRADLVTGAVLYRMSEVAARTVEETLAAVLFIAENVRVMGKRLSTMGESAKRFITDWESEKYRKSLAEKGKTP